MWKWIGLTILAAAMMGFAAYAKGPVELDFRMNQRTQRALPLFPDLTLSLDDIKGGSSVVAKLTGPEGVLTETTMGEDDRIEFVRGGRTYAVVITHLEDAPLLDEDWAEVSLIEVDRPTGAVELRVVQR